MNKTNIVGIDIDILSKQELYSILVKTLKRSGQLKIFTPNPVMLNKATKNPLLYKALKDADMLLPDGIGVSIVSKIKNGRPAPRVTGIETAYELLKIAQSVNASVFFLGAQPGVAELARENILKIFPNLNICGIHHGYFNVDNDQESSYVLKKIQAISPEIIFVCMGSPRQELWIHKYASRVPSASILIGLGGTLDVWSGKTKRAPRAIQRAGLEWLWRFATQPQRIREILHIPPFLFKALFYKKKKDVSRGERP